MLFLLSNQLVSVTRGNDLELDLKPVPAEHEPCVSGTVDTFPPFPATNSASNSHETSVPEVSSSSPGSNRSIPGKSNLHQSAKNLLSCHLLKKSLKKDRKS